MAEDDIRPLCILLMFSKGQQHIVSGGGAVLTTLCCADIVVHLLTKAIMNCLTLSV